MEIQIKEVIKKSEKIMDQSYKIYLDVMILKQELNKVLDDFNEKKEAMPKHSLKLSEMGEASSEGKGRI